MTSSHVNVEFSLSDDQAYLAQCWAENRCPQCKQPLTPDSRVGTGKKREGGFCSLQCYAQYNALKLAAKLNRPSRGGNEH